MASILELSRCLRLTDYKSSNIAKWREIFADTDLSIKNHKSYSSFLADDMICAVYVKSDGTVLEYVDLPSRKVKVNTVKEKLDTNVIPTTHSDFTQYRSSVRQGDAQAASRHANWLIEAIAA